MRIAIDARGYSTSTGYYVKGLLNGLKKIDTKNHYIVLMKSKDIDQFTTQLNFEKIVADYEEFTFNEQIGFLKQLNSLKADLVHFPAVQQPILYHGRVVTTFQDLTALRFRNPARNPIVYRIMQQVFKFVNQLVSRKSVYLITPTDFVRHDVAEYTGISLDKIIFTHEAVALPNVSAQPIESLKNKKFLMYIGRPQPHKNIARLMEAHARLVKKYPDLLLVLAGKIDSMYDTYKELATKLGTRDKVVFTGWVTDGEKRWLMERTIVFVASSLSEGFFISGIDAMSCGTPVASSNTSCLPEVHGKAAHYFDPYDVADMAQAIDDVMSDQKLRKQLIEAGYENIKRFSWEKMARQTLEIYERNK
jgi:glycosyltransferase involved in cell wall biosynthesis